MTSAWRYEGQGEVVADERGVPRVIFRTPDWEDYVQVAC